MSIVMYDLVGVDDRRFSPHCWRARMALAHKGLDCETRATRFTDIQTICDRQQKTLPVLQDGDNIICDSWEIAWYLEHTYPDRPSLFGGDAGRSLCVFIQNWTGAIVQVGLVRMIISDIHGHLLPEDQDYFRASREKRFGRSLEDAQADREQRVEEFRKSLNPLRMTVRTQPFISGDHPLYADYLVFGAFQWARTISPFRILEDDDPVRSWFERCLDLYEGLGRNAPGYY